MADDVVAPVRSILKAFDNGVKLAKRVSRSTSEVSSAKALEISESTKSLQKALETDAKAVSDSYFKSMAAVGNSFTKALTNDSRRFPGSYLLLQAHVYRILPESTERCSN